MAQLKIAKEETNNKQRQQDSQNLTDSIISAADSSTRLEDLQASNGSLSARGEAVINSDLSDPQKQAQLAQLGAARKVVEIKMVKPQTSAYVKAALAGDPHPTKEDISEQSRATLLQDFSEATQTDQESMLEDPDFQGIVSNTNTVLPALRNAQALG